MNANAKRTSGSTSASGEDRAQLKRLRSERIGECAPGLGELLRRQELEQAGDVPAFASVASRIEASPSSIDAPPWSAAKSLRVSGALALSQLRIVPQAVLPAACIMAAAAVLAANFANTAAATWMDETWLFSILLLVGAAITVTLALSAERADAVSLATPVGPQTVTLVRVAAVLCIDVAAGGAACLFSMLAGIPLDPGGLVSTWLVPLAAVSGASAFVAVWTGSPWAGTIVGVACIPLVVPVAHAAAHSGAGALIAAFQQAVGPLGIVLVGIALLAAAICSARRATVARMQAA